MQCVICKKSKDVVIHVHHVIPQAYGGRDGPTVELCADHHNMIHAAAVKIASAIRRGKAVDFVWPKEHGDCDVARHLVGAIVKASLKTNTKQYKYTIVLTQHERDMLELLKQAYGVSSLEKAIYNSLEDAFKLQFN